MSATITRKQPKQPKAERPRSDRARPEPVPAADSSSDGKAKRATPSIREILASAIHQTTAMSEIRPSALNARKDFNAAELQSLADSLQTIGLIEPVVLRPHVSEPDGEPFFEIICGERRFRAAQLAKWKEIPSKIVGVDDVGAMLLRAAENLQRKDLNAIEEAHEFRHLTTPVAAGGAGLRQEEVARQLGRTQGHVANRIRLLELPDWWQARIISGEITPSLAREALAWKDYPAVLAKAEKDLAAAIKAKDPERLPSVEDFREQLVEIVAKIGGKLCRHVSRGNLWCEVRINATPEQRKALQLVEVKRRWGGKDVYAMNAELYRELYAAAEQKALAKAAKKTGTSVDPVELKAQEKRAKSSAKREEFRRRLESWVEDWTRYLCWKNLGEKQTRADRTTLARFYLWIIAKEGIGELDRAIAGAGLKGVIRNRYNFPFSDLRKIPKEKLDAVLVEACRGFLCDADGEPIYCDCDGLFPFLAEDLGIDHAAAWRRERGGPVLTELLFKLYDRDALIDLAAELGIIVDRSGKFDDLAEEMLKAKPGEAMPAAIADLLAPKAKRGRKAKGGR